MRLDDLDQVLIWRNYPDVRNYMFTKHNISPDEHKSWFKRVSADPHKHLLIYELGGIPSGFASIHQLNGYDVADWGFYLAPDAPIGSGLGLGVTVLDYAFSSLKLHKICGQALEFNTRSIKFHARLGFQKEGILREQHYDGQRHSAVYCFGLLRNEWLETRKG